MATWTGAAAAWTDVVASWKGAAATWTGVVESWKDVVSTWKVLSASWIGAVSHLMTDGAIVRIVYKNPRGKVLGTDRYLERPQEKYKERMGLKLFEIGL
jgi:hypothetical protein